MRSNLHQETVFNHVCHVVVPYTSIFLRAKVLIFFVFTKLFHNFLIKNTDIEKTSFPPPPKGRGIHDVCIMNKNASALFYPQLAKFIVPCQQGFKPIHANLGQVYQVSDVPVGVSHNGCTATFDVH